MHTILHAEILSKRVFFFREMQTLYDGTKGTSLLKKGKFTIRKDKTSLLL
jgi:hypothetical protein